MYKILHIPSAAVVYERPWSFDSSRTVKPDIINKGMSLDLSEHYNNVSISSAYPILFETKEIARYYLDSHKYFLPIMNCGSCYILFYRRENRYSSEYNIRQHEFELVEVI